MDTIKIKIEQIEQEVEKLAYITSGNAVPYKKKVLREIIKKYREIQELYENCFK